MRIGFAAIALCGVLSASGAARADDWVADKLRGIVLVQQGDSWVHMTRGDVVSDARFIRTMSNGYVEFERNGETIELGANTQAQIHDRTGQHFTTVSTGGGAVQIADKHESVPHFAVQTPFVAAVVKGTVFTVTTTPTGSNVAVDKGEVSVTDVRARTSVSITADQHASAGASQSLSAGGAGTLQPIRNQHGAIVSVATAGGETAVAGGIRPANLRIQGGSGIAGGRGASAVIGGKGDLRPGRGNAGGRFDNGRGNGGPPGKGFGGGFQVGSYSGGGYGGGNGLGSGHGGGNNGGGGNSGHGNSGGNGNGNGGGGGGGKGRH